MDKINVTADVFTLPERGKGRTLYNIGLGIHTLTLITFPKFLSVIIVVLHVQFSFDHVSTASETSPGVAQFHVLHIVLNFKIFILQVFISQFRISFE